MSAGRQDSGGWLALFRIPNFLTVPGDVVAGSLLLSGGTFFGSGAIGAAIAASLCLYGAGLLLNDWADVDEDRKTRPNRPIPSGRVSRNAVLRAVAALLGAGVLLASTAGILALICAIALGAAILLYNLAAKHGRFTASAIMGLCRGLNFLLGAAAAASLSENSVANLTQIAWGFCIVALYISSVTWLAHRETEGGYQRWEAWLPVGIPAIGAIACITVIKPGVAAQWQAIVFAWVFFLTLAIRTAKRFSNVVQSAAVRAAAAPELAIPPLIGKWIGALIPLQSALIFSSGKSLEVFIAGTAILGLWPLQRMLAKWFYSS